MQVRAHLSPPSERARLCSRARADVGAVLVGSALLGFVSVWRRSLGGAFSRAVAAPPGGSREALEARSQAFSAGSQRRGLAL